MSLAASFERLAVASTEAQPPPTPEQRKALRLARAAWEVRRHQAENEALQRIRAETDARNAAFAKQLEDEEREILGQ